MENKRYTDEWIDACGDICQDDEIKFEEDVYTGSYRNPKFVGVRTIHARIITENYGKQKQQHTFILDIINVEGVNVDEVFRVYKKRGRVSRKGRNIHRNKCLRRKWVNEDERHEFLKEKHKRGTVARKQRELRKSHQEKIDNNSLI